MLIDTNTVLVTYLPSLVHSQEMFNQRVKPLNTTPHVHMRLNLL